MLVIKSQDELTFTPQSVLFVLTKIRIADIAGIGRITRVVETFRVPEPSSLSMILCAGGIVACFALARRWRAKRAGNAA